MTLFSWCLCSSQKRWATSFKSLLTLSGMIDASKKKRSEIQILEVTIFLELAKKRSGQGHEWMKMHPARRGERLL